jgi:hypothetical protein
MSQRHLRPRSSSKRSERTINQGGGTSTDLRIAILDAFDESGITSPLPRTDVTLRNIDWLHGIVAEYASAASNRRKTQGESSLASLSRTLRSEREIKHAAGS